MILRQQLALIEGKLVRPLRVSRIERLTLAVTASKSKAVTHRTIAQLDDILRIFRPDTVIGWHRAAARRKWYQQAWDHL